MINASGTAAASVKLRFSGNAGEHALARGKKFGLGRAGGDAENAVARFEGFYARRRFLLTSPANSRPGISCETPGGAG